MRTGPRLSPVVDEFERFDLTLLDRRWAGLQVVGSASVVRDSTGVLLPGPPVVILAPVEWMGEDVARVRLATYGQGLTCVTEFFAKVRLLSGVWRVVEPKGGVAC